MKIKLINFQKINLKIFLSVIIVIIVLAQIKYDIGTSYAYADEMGYWGTAASLVGLDWSGIMSNISYYSYLYGILLTPIMAIPVDPQIHYQMGIILNALMLVLTFLISYKSSKQIMPDIQDSLMTIICFVSTLYSSYIYYSQNTSGEILYLLLFWCTIYACIRYIKYSKISNLIAFMSLAVVDFMAHMRSVSILCASIVMVILLNILRKKISHIVIAAVNVFVLSFTHFIIKNNIVQNIYLHNELTNHNDVAGQLDKLSYIFSIDGLIDVIHMILGRIFYLGNSSFLIFYIGIFACLINFFLTLKNKNSVLENDCWFISLFIVLSLIFSVGVSSLFFQNPGDCIQYLMYGRYSDYIIMPFLIIGIVYIIKNNNLKLYSFVIFIHLTLSTYLYEYVCRKGINKNSIHPNTPGTAGLLSYFQNNSEQVQATIFIGLIAVLVFVLVLVVNMNMKKNKAYSWNGIVVVEIVLTIWLVSTFKYINVGVHSDEILAMQREYQELAQIIEKYDNETDDVLFLYDFNWKDDRIAHYLQYKIPNITLRYTLYDEFVNSIESCDEKYFIIGKYVEQDKYLIESINKSYTIIEDNSNVIFFVRNDCINL